MWKCLGSCQANESTLFHQHSINRCYSLLWARHWAAARGQGVPGKMFTEQWETRTHHAIVPLYTHPYSVWKDQRRFRHQMVVAWSRVGTAGTERSGQVQCYVWSNWMKVYLKKQCDKHCMRAKWRRSAGEGVSAWRWHWNSALIWKRACRTMGRNGKILQEGEILWIKLPGHGMSLCPWRMRRGYLGRPVGWDGREGEIDITQPQIFNTEDKWENSLFLKDTNSFNHSFSIYRPWVGNLEIPSYRFYSLAPKGTYFVTPPHPQHQLQYVLQQEVGSTANQSC